MSGSRPLPEATRQRLELLKRILEELESLGRQRVNSRELGRWVGATPNTVRKDLAGSGPGTPGAAYEVADLLQRLAGLLSPSLPHRTALVGLGDLGLALAQGNVTFLVGFDGRPNRLNRPTSPSRSSRPPKLFLSACE